MSTAAKAPARPTAAGFCPYVGLAPFEAEHAAYYFGRDLDAANLADNVLVAPVTVLYGASGVGKTSLLNVGLRKALETLGQDATLVLFRRWQGDQFRSSQFREIASAAGIPAADLHAAPRDLAEFIAWIGERTGNSLILGLDQFEEYFVYQDGERARAFEQELDALVRSGADAHLLIAIRDDRYHLLDRLRSTVSGILDNSLELAHLDESAVRAAITGPIRVYNQHRPRAERIVLDDAFVDRLITQLREVEAGAGKEMLDAEAREIELPYLQLALTKIWEAAGGVAAKRLDAAILEERSVRQIVRHHLDQVLGALDREDQALCARIFDRMVTPSGAKIAMKAADLAVLARARDQTGRVERILADLSRPESRIFTPVPHPEGAPAYEIFHDVLGRPVLDWKERYEIERELEKEKERYESELEREKERQEAERRVEEQRQRAEEERRRAEHQKRRFRITAALAAAMALFALAAFGFGWYAIAAKREADLARAAALESRDMAEAARMQAESAQREVEEAVEAVEAARMQAESARIQGEEALERARLAQTRLLTLASSEALEKGQPETAALLALKALPTGPVESETRHFADAERALWDAWQAMRLQNIAHPVLTGGPFHAFALSSDGRRLAAASENGVDWSSGTGFSRFRGFPGNVSAVAFSTDGRRLATASDDGTARLWNVATGEAIMTLEGDGPVTAVAFSTDGRRLATASEDGTAQLWDAETGAAITTLGGRGSPVSAVTFSPDGHRLATASEDGSARLWDAANGEVVSILRGHEGSVIAVAFSPDADRLATASRDNTARLWDANSGAEIATLRGHEGEVSAVAFSPDGHRLATASEDGTARLWDAATGAPIVTLGGKDGPIMAVGFDPTGADLITVDSAGEVRLWRVPRNVRELIETVRNRLPRLELTQAEKERFLLE